MGLESETSRLQSAVLDIHLVYLCVSDNTCFHPYCQKVIKSLRLKAARTVEASSRRSKIIYAVQDASLGIIAMLKIL